MSRTRLKSIQKVLTPNVHQSKMIVAETTAHPRPGAVPLTSVTRLHTNTLRLAGTALGSLSALAGDATALCWRRPAWPWVAGPDPTLASVPQFPLSSSWPPRGNSSLSPLLPLDRTEHPGRLPDVLASSGQGGSNRCSLSKRNDVDFTTGLKHFPNRGTSSNTKSVTPRWPWLLRQPPLHPQDNRDFLLGSRRKVCCWSQPRARGGL